MTTATSLFSKASLSYPWFMAWITVTFSLSSFLLTSKIDAFKIDPAIMMSVRGGQIEKKHDAYEVLAKAIQPHLREDDILPEIDQIVKAFMSLSSSQQAFKGLDGAAHEAYQRTQSSEEVDLNVAGRAQRSAARAGATADGLGALELCELIEFPQRCDMESLNGTLGGREVLLNVSRVAKLGHKTHLSVLVLWEPSYGGGSGVNHGGILDTPTGKVAQGRILVILSDSSSLHLGKILSILSEQPQIVQLNKGLVSGESASVQPALYTAAGRLIENITATLQLYNQSAVHIVGRSLAGGVAALTAIILDGVLPIPKSRAGSLKGKKSRKKAASGSNATTVNVNKTEVGYQGMVQGRVSAVSLGAPPCVSANVPAAFVTSILYGDDIVCRASKSSIDRFLRRTQKAIESGGIIGRQLNWVSDAVSLAASNLMNHALGSDGEEARLAVPGQAYLLRPRRLGGLSSIHEVGNQLKGGREALRAALLWQLNDILLSGSLWKHHELEAYIHGLDRTHLRAVNDERDFDTEVL